MHKQIKTDSLVCLQAFVRDFTGPNVDGTTRPIFNKGEGTKRIKNTHWMDLSFDPQYISAPSGPIASDLAVFFIGRTENLASHVPSSSYEKALTCPVKRPVKTISCVGLNVRSNT